MRGIRSVALVLLLASCGRSGEFERSAVAPPPPAVVLTASLGPLSLDEKLALLEEELAAGEEGDAFDDQAIARLFRAEAITDRLLESRLPFAWLSEGYDLEARIRQIQSLADRLVAMVMRGTDQEEFRAEMATLRRQVAELRLALRQPGGEAPPSLDELLASVMTDSIRAQVSEGETGE